MSIINYLHQGTYRPGVIFRSGIMGPALRRIGVEQMIEYTYMPMLESSSAGPLRWSGRTVATRTTAGATS